MVSRNLTTWVFSVCAVYSLGEVLLKYLSYSNTNQAPHTPPPKLNLSLDIKLTGQVRPVFINWYLFQSFFLFFQFLAARGLCVQAALWVQYTGFSLR